MNANRVTSALQAQIPATVKTDLEKSNVRLVWATDFGVKTDGSDNADALWQLGQFISGATEPLYVIFPRGVSRVGSQEIAGAAGKGYSWRPTYFNRPWADPADCGWFSVHRTENDITLDMRGWTLKMNDGMRQGSFDPVTGEAWHPASLPFYDYDYQASHGILVKFYRAPGLKVIGGTIDGNIPGCIWGGKFGDDGWQVPSFNLWINQCRGIRLDDTRIDSSPVDGIYISNGVDEGAISPLSDYTASFFNNVVVTNAGRNCWSYTGGHDDVFSHCIGQRAGKCATGIGTHFSSPQAAIDIESEAGAIARLTFGNCKFTDGGLAGIQLYGPVRDISDIRINGGIIHAPSGGLALHNTARNIYLREVKVIGSVSTPTGEKINALSMENCEIYNRVGNVWVTDFHLYGVFQKFIGCDIHYEIPPGDVTSPIMNMTGNPFIGFGGSLSQFKRVTLFIAGDSARQTVQLGAVSGFRDASIFISAGITGTNPITLYMTESSPDTYGFVTNSPLINFGGAMVKRPDAYIWFDATAGIYANPIYPSIDNHIPLGRSGQEFTQLFVNKGVQMRSADGSKWLLGVNNGGALTVTRQ